MRFFNFFGQIANDIEDVLRGRFLQKIMLSVTAMEEVLCVENGR